MATMVSTATTAPPEAVWAVVADVSRHGAHIPLTTVVHDPGLPYPGWGFTAFTGLGPARMPDRMAVVEWEPPRRARFVKLGPVLLGWAEIVVEPEGSGSVVTWTEEIALPFAVRTTRRVGDVAVRRMVTGALAGLLDEAEGTRRSVRTPDAPR